MKYLRSTVLPILLAGIWINICEFARNELLLKSEWNEHFGALGLVFPSAPLNLSVWVIWGFSLAAAILVISRKFSMAGTVILAWLMAFLMMWLVTWNLEVLPVGILRVAVPFSLLEVLIASLIVRKLQPRQSE